MAALLPERWFTGTILGTARFSAAFQHLRVARVSIHNLVNCSAEGFALAMDVSCRSFIRMAKFAAPLMIDGSCLLTISFYGGAGESCS
jgi:enoyl-[acyl-carrier-protein] reductase (NADH)